MKNITKEKKNLPYMKMEDLQDQPKVFPQAFLDGKCGEPIEPQNYVQWVQEISTT